MKFTALFPNEVSSYLLWPFSSGFWHQHCHVHHSQRCEGRPEKVRARRAERLLQVRCEARNEEHSGPVRDGGEGRGGALGKLSFTLINTLINTLIFNELMGAP